MASSREVFVGKVVSLLQHGVSVSLVDLMSTRQANLYAELLATPGRSDPKLGETPPAMYAVTLRGRKYPPPKRKQRARPAVLDAWFYPMTLGQPLPTLPIRLAVDHHVMWPLGTSYEEACRVLSIA